MIRINRGAAPPTVKVYSRKTLTAVDGVRKVTKAEREIEKATVFFTDTSNYLNEQKLTKGTFTFNVYKDPELVAALEAIFEKKCAYCESRFAHVTPKDIEHFRPKSEINTGTATLRPGYFWLACDWDNLLISCPNCNRQQSHEIPGQAANAVLGKGTQFPLSDESCRLRTKGSLVNEEAVRLLLNPCVDDPEDHLTFDEKGLIYARDDGFGILSQKGTVSITVYALQRKTLVEERLRVLNVLRLNFQQLNHLVLIHNGLHSTGASHSTLGENANQIRALREAITSMLAPSSPYLAMLRAWIRNAHQRGDFERLLQFKIDPLALLDNADNRSLKKAQPSQPAGADSLALGAATFQ